MYKVLLVNNEYGWYNEIWNNEVFFAVWGDDNSQILAVIVLNQVPFSYKAKNLATLLPKLCLLLEIFDCSISLVC